MKNLVNALILSVVSLSFAAPALAIEPAVDNLADRGWRRGAATGLVFLVMLVLTTVLVWVIANLVIQQVRSLVDDAPDLVRDTTRWINDRFNTHITTDKIVEQLRKYQGNIAGTATDVGGRVVSVTGSVRAGSLNCATIDGGKYCMSEARSGRALGSFELSSLNRNSERFQRLRRASQRAPALSIRLK